MLKRRKDDLTLYDVLNAGYKNKNVQANTLNQYGYRMNRKMSNDNEQVYYNPKSKKLLVNVTGTHNAKDWITDLYLATGNLKATSRYKEADDLLKKAKQRYHVDTSTIVGHSLGGSVASYIGSRNDHVIGLDSGFSPFQKTRSNVKQYRTAGDVVSIAGANAKRTVTLTNNNLRTGIIPFDALLSHNVSNIKGAKIYI